MEKELLFPFIIHTQVERITAIVTKMNVRHLLNIL